MTIVDKVLHFFRLRQRGINIKRVACVICKSQKLTQLKEIKDFPAYMGVYDGKASFNLGNLRYMRCDNCSSLQLGELIPLEILYQSNHNVGIIGETWTQHFEQLGSFIIKNSNCDKILEIGDPSAKTALVCAQKSSYYEWVIIEPFPPLLRCDTKKCGLITTSRTINYMIPLFFHMYLSTYITQLILWLK